MAKSWRGKPDKAKPTFARWVFPSRTSKPKRVCYGTTFGCFTRQCPLLRRSEYWRLPLASPQLETILAAMFQAEFCPREQKRLRELARDELLRAEADRAGIPWERLKLAILSGRYPEYR